MHAHSGWKSLPDELSNNPGRYLGTSPGWSAPMHTYFAFGRPVRSTIPLATLLPFPDGSTGGPVGAAPAPALLRVQRQSLSARTEHFVPVGADPWAPCNLTLWRHDQVLRFEHACTGVFEYDAHTRTIIADVPEHVTDEALRLDLVNRLLPLAVHDDGDLCLHASAAVLPDGAALFAAEKGTGKSSLAAALVAAGAPLIGDDAVAVQLAGGTSGDAPMAFVGSVALRVRSDAMDAATMMREAVRTDAAWAHVSATIDGKLSVALAEALTVAPTVATPIRAIYLIEPAPADALAAATRERLGAFEAAVRLQAHGKLGQLLTGREADRQFHAILSLVMQVPVYRLDVARSLDRLPEVVAMLQQWHAAEQVA